MCKHNLCSLKMQDSQCATWDFERWSPKTKCFLMKMYFNNCHPTFFLVAFSPCRGTNKHQWRWRKSIWTRHYVGGNFLSNWVILKEKDLAGQEEYWKTKRRFIWSLLEIYKNTWYERLLVMHHLEEMLETFLISTKVRIWLTQHNSLPNIRKTTPLSIEGGSVAFSLLLDKLEIILLIISF